MRNHVPYKEDVPLINYGMCGWRTMCTSYAEVSIWYCLSLELLFLVKLATGIMAQCSFKRSFL